MRWLSAITGLMATAGAVVTLGAMSPGATTAEPMPATMSVVDEFAEELADESANRPRIVYPPSQEVDLSNLDPAIARALSGGGYTELVSINRLSVELPEDVLAALLAHDAVLVVPSEDTIPEETD